MRLEKAERRLDSLLDALDATNDANRRLRDGVKQMVQSETHALMARNAELARNYMDLSRRLDQVLLAVQGGTFNPTNPDQLPKDADGFGAVMDSFTISLKTSTGVQLLTSAADCASICQMSKAR